EQAQVNRDYIMKNPFKSKINNGIYNLVEMVLEILQCLQRLKLLIILLVNQVKL
ncbi:unnamed protein product, partial [marine sediment metagenome]